jgi:hypothetical protein
MAVDWFFHVMLELGSVIPLVTMVPMPGQPVGHAASKIVAPVGTVPTPSVTVF